MIKIIEENNKKDWEDFLKYCSQKTFLTSWNWGEFQKKMGNKIWRLSIYQNSQQIGSFLLIKIKAKFRNFFFIPHGPVLKDGCLKSSEIKKEILLEILKFLKNISEKENIDFIRFAPIWKNNQENEKLFEELKFIKAISHIHPEVTWFLDISIPENEILMGMRKNTRNLIRRAQKEGVEIIQKNSIDGIEDFNNLYKKTVARQYFNPFSLKYLKNEFESFYSDNQIINIFAKYKNEIISSAIIIFWQGMGFYHQGASSQKYPKIPASYLLQWEAIKKAKNNGCKLYNFWGIVPQINSSEDLKNNKIKKHPWWGISLFKMGFGGYKQEYLKTYDLPLTWRYQIQKTIENLRKIKRGY